MSRVLIVGDPHEPVCREGYLQFCKTIYKKYNCNRVIIIGDIVDWQAISFHIKHPECPGPKDEYKLAKAKVQKWYRAFPQAKVCIGNHDARPERLAQTVDIPACFLKDYKTLWKTPHWTWDYSFWIDGVYYTHGTNTGGVHPAWTVAGKIGESVVLGHNHSRAGVKWRTNPARRFFAMDVGCGIDIKAFQFAYGRDYVDRPVLACGVVINKIPYHEIFPAEKYSK